MKLSTNNAYKRLLLVVGNLSKQIFMSSILKMLLPILVAASVQPSICLNRYSMLIRNRGIFLYPFYFNVHQFRLFSRRPPKALSRHSRHDRANNLAAMKRHLAAENDYSIPSSNKYTDTKQFTSLTFFKFVEISEKVLDDLVNEYKFQLSHLFSRGSLIIASEGLNGQFCVPTDQLGEFMQTIRAVLRRNLLSDGVDFNLGDTHRYPVAVGNDNNVDGGNYEPLLSVPEGLVFPFRKLIVRRKRAILSDGMLREKGLQFDWQDAGPELSPAEWHESLANLESTEKQEKQPLLLDCRNTYESEMGTFKGSVPLNTSSFGESWKNLEEILADQPRDRPVLTFCTGGIRCVKVNAYLKQRLGFQSVGRLQKGIIGYQQWLQEEERRNQSEGNPQVQSHFQGENFLFDRRRMQPNSADPDTDTDTDQQ